MSVHRVHPKPLTLRYVQYKFWLQAVIGKLVFVVQG
jgi:hypothetical protein